MNTRRFTYAKKSGRRSKRLPDDLNVSELARRSGVSRRQMGAILSGESEPGFTTIRKLASAFGSSEADVVTWLSKVRDC